MTPQELDILLRDDSREAIERHLADDPARAALQLGKHAALLATQIKYLQRVRAKLPAYYEARCIIPPLAFEQSSSEETARSKQYGGELCIDLTCGLGADSYFLSKRFRRVIAVERDPVLAAVARINFSRLGATNIEVVHTTAESFVGSFTGRADLIYADPARRGGNDRRLVLLEECSPDITAMLPALQSAGRLIVVKASPLFDVEEAFRLFGEGIRVEAVSLRGECKELLIELGEPYAVNARHAGRLTATSVRLGSVGFGRDELREPVPDRPFSPPYGFLLVPDVSLYKIRAARRYMDSLGAFTSSDAGYGFAASAPPDFLGHAYPVTEIIAYRPRLVRSLLRERGIDRLNILKRDFPIDAGAIAKALGIREGGTRFAAFTTVQGTRFAVLLG